MLIQAVCDDPVHIQTGNTADNIYYRRKKVDEAAIKKIIAEIESKLTGDPEHDAEIWDEYGEQYRGKPGAEPLLMEIGRRLFALAAEADGISPEEIFDDMVSTADEDYEEACRLIEQRQYEEAAHKLLVLTAVYSAYPLPEDTVWKDFHSYLDSLIYQDYFEEEIAGREIGRHPMRPGRILYTCGNLFIEMGEAEQAIEPLQMLLDCDPVCPQYLFELGEAYKRTGRLQDAYNTAKWSLHCASNREELARGYRDIAYCFSETGSYEDAVMLYLLSLRFHASRQAEAEIAWIQKQSGVAAENFHEEDILQRCKELDIPTGLSEVVENNLALLDMLMGDQNKDEEN